MTSWIDVPDPVRCGSVLEMDAGPVGEEPGVQETAYDHVNVVGHGPPERLGITRLTVAFLIILLGITSSFFLAPAMLPEGYISEIGEEEGSENQANRINFSGNWSQMIEDGHYFEAAIYYFGDFNCHQLPERSYSINGNQQPVCSRDIGMFLGGTLGALALMAVPYNLMHILIEDGIAKPGDWWYPSPYYVADREVKTGEI